MVRKIVIDPGHAPGNANGGPNGYKEYAGMWSLSTSLKAALEQYGFTVELTRTESANPTLTERGKKAAGCELFISEHSNAANGKARGAEVYYSLKIPNDRTFAADMSKEIAAFMGNPDRGAKTRESTNTKGADYYTVINQAQKAGAKHVLLIESGFHDNEQDEQILMNTECLMRMAELQAAVIARNLEPMEKTAAPVLESSGLTAITGKAVASADQMRAYISRLNPHAPDIAALYLAEGDAEGIRGDVAFAQSCLETGNFLYTNSAVTPDQHNYCGMGVTQNGMKGNSFPTEAEGIRAQIQHLKAYANTEPLNGVLIDPRFTYVERGVSPYVETLGAAENPRGKGWAMGAGYGAKILKILDAISRTEVPNNPQKPRVPFYPYTVKVTTDELNIRKGPGTDNAVCGIIKDYGVYTIVEESEGNGGAKWGRLKSDAGWISLDFTKRL